MTAEKNFHERNRESWNNATVAHNSHKAGQDVFFRNKGSTLYKEEKGILGDLTGLSVCHLQCNCGQDTLSLVNTLGASNPVGVDISDTAVEFAQKLSRDSGIEATFTRSDVFDFLETTEQRFDVVFASYGVTGWLSDLKSWGAGIERILKPGGRFCYVEFHPTNFIYNRDMVRQYPYSSAGETITEEEGVSDYVAQSSTSESNLIKGINYQVGVQDFRNPAPSFEFAWGLADVMGSLAEAGLNLRHFKEYPYSNFFKMYNDMTSEEVEEGTRWYNKGPMLPLMYSIVFTKP